MANLLIGAFTIALVCAVACLPLVAVYGGGVDWTRGIVTDADHHGV